MHQELLRPATRKKQAIPCPGGTSDNSPTFQRWEPNAISPKGTADGVVHSPPSFRDLYSVAVGSQRSALGYRSVALKNQIDLSLNLCLKFAALRQIQSQLKMIKYCPHSNLP